MRYLLLFLFLALFLHGCESLDVERFLQGRYCPKAFVLQGAATSSAAELGKMGLACSISWSGKLGQNNFRVKQVSIVLDVWARRIGTQDRNIFLFANVLDGQRKIKQVRFSMRAKELWSKQPIAFTFTPAPKRNIKDYLILVGLEGS
jgi:hypothetical protein